MLQRIKHDSDEMKKKITHNNNTNNTTTTTTTTITTSTATETANNECESHNRRIWCKTKLCIKCMEKDVIFQFIFIYWNVLTLLLGCSCRKTDLHKWIVRFCVCLPVADVVLYIHFFLAFCFLFSSFFFLLICPGVFYIFVCISFTFIFI